MGTHRLSRQLICVTKSKTGGGEGREIPLTSRLSRSLLSRQRQPEGTVFTFKGHTIAKIKTAWKGAIRRAGIRYLRFHDLRHTANTRSTEPGFYKKSGKRCSGTRRAKKSTPSTRTLRCQKSAKQFGNWSPG